MSRYDRQSRIKQWNQTSITNSKAILIGAGALGCVAGVNLALAGVGEIVLIDMDTVAVSNLNRQLLFRDEHVGEEKALVAADALHQMNPTITVTGLTRRVEHVPKTTFQPSKQGQKVVVVDGLDNFDTRRWVNSFCVNAKLPLISGGMYGFLGNVQVILPGRTPCLECQPLIPEKQLQKACTPPGKRRREAAKQREKDEDPLPAVSSITTIIGGLMTQEYFKLVIDEASVTTEYIFYDGLSQSFHLIPLAIRPDCIVCSSRYRLDGIPFGTDPEETLEMLSVKIALLLDAEAPEIVHKGVTLTKYDTTIKKLFKDGDVIYAVARNLPNPRKFQLQFHR
jgi:molybdopterin/thiamine biosynthesis adenylyltransferase